MLRKLLLLLRIIAVMMWNRNLSAVSWLHFYVKFRLHQACCISHRISINRYCIFMLYSEYHACFSNGDFLANMFRISTRKKWFCWKGLKF